MLRLAEEKLARKRKEEEEAWEPFIPETPSPILQCLYTDTPGRFWLSLVRVYCDCPHTHTCTGISYSSFVCWLTCKQLVDSTVQ